MARVWIRTDQLHNAERWAAGRERSSTDAGEYLAEYDHQTHVRLFLA